MSSGTQLSSGTHMPSGTQVVRLTADALDALQEGVLLSDAAGRVVDANAAASRILGLPPEDLVGRPVAVVGGDPVDVSGDPLPERDHPTHRAARTGRTSAAVLGVRRPAGRLVWLHVSASPFTLEEPVRRGAPQPVLTTFVDITAQMLQRQALQSSEERFRRTFQDAPIGMSIMALNGRFQQVNTALTTILGRTEEELLATTTDALVLPEDRDRDREQRRALDAGEVESYQVQARFLQGTGETVWTRLTVSLVRGRDGEPQHYVGQMEDVSEVRRAHDLLERRALYDHLTGLANRSLLLDRLTHALGVHARAATLVAVVFMDLDHFKRINDSLGHDAGDRLLTAVAARMQSAVRPSDTVARLGGDEFVLVMEGVSSVDAAGHALQRVLDTVQQPVTIGDHEVVPSVSAGLTVSDGSRTADQVLGDADTALYVAKERGRSRWEVYDEAYRTQALHRLEVEQDLRASIGRGELELHYQPIVDLRTGAVVALEALVRWQHPRRGLLLPEEFIDVCEQAHLMPSLGAWVLGEACGFLARHPDFTGQVFVNVSPRQIGRADLSRVVRDALTTHRIEPHRLGLEITESGVLQAAGSARLDLERLASMGVTLVLDDFGTGYSALSSVLSAPVDGLKLDRSFTARLGDDGAADRISTAIAALAESLRRYGVVEGVETTEQRDRALAHGWTHGQGWLFGHPVPEDGVAAVMAGPSAPRSAGDVPPDAAVTRV
ncbi:EAL domain-containing protein [Cellulomonas sp. ATA003]|uniref:putative bifunctional diguanylate cyclase/phosphodiesterase n=1 Tax=Cellulomonas sp. ATA003 TaxID=3073064 RepID=UPI002872D08E|nr:EAL domain-containing protein [Cellulomonas sp. ATA003]WNB84608.1 EAL domain-containing protein [Cellulomonas sp. ATA003]